MIEWSELKPYQNDKYRSFEELCYQIAKGLHGAKGRFTSVDDSGGGDGVEFYLTLPNGDQWGWQAKFYYPEPRLSESGRKRSITNSLKRACEIHPHLKKWFLCTPTNFTPDEQKWFDNTLRQSISEDIEIEHWGNSDFNNWMRKEHFSGKRHYFFGELELNLDWFKRQFDKQMAGVGDKFDSSLHTETDVDAEIHALLGDEKSVEQITESIEKLEGELADLKDAVDNLNNPVHKDIEWDLTEKEKVTDAAKSLQDVLIKTINQFKQIKKLLKKKMLFEAQAINWEFVIKRLEDALNIYRTVIDESGISKIKYTGESKYKVRVLNDTEWLVGRPDSIIANLLDDFLYYDRYPLINKSNLNILGDAGIGKTHIACNICNERLKDGLPALFIRGSLFTSEKTLEKQLQDILDISPYFNWSDFLQALSAAAEAYHTRIPLVIDGLNETTHNGAFSRIWELYLKGFIHEIAQAKNVVLITTCRTSYKGAIWDDEYPLNSISAVGFDTEKVKREAIDKYFNAYKIVAEPTLAPFMQFEHPLHLKIFCETKNRERKTEVQVYGGEQSLFEVFDKYLKQCNKEVCKRLALRPGTSVIQPALDKIAEYLWQHSTRNINIEKMAYIVDGKYFEEPQWWESSKTRAIEAESLLVCRNRWEGEDVMYFTYDLLGSYLIAQYLVEQAAGDLQALLNSEEAVALLFSEDYQTLHPMHEGICRCLAALLPAKTGQFLYELSDNETAFSLSIRALFEISPRYISEDCINLITHLFELPENRNLFLELTESTIAHPGHPFDASFWSDQLLALSMVERDLSWSEHIRLHRENFEKIVIRFKETCQNAQNLSEASVKRLHLLAEYIMWILTSTVRPLRDEATRALYWYGRRFPQKFFELVTKSLTINDPYVSERMLAAIYGIAMARQNDFEDTSFATGVLPSYGKQLYEAMFKPDAPYATTHILARDYAKRTIDIALIHHPDLLTDDERERITPPFTDGGIREWGESERREEGFPPIQMDFEDYTLRGLIKSDNKNPNEHKNILANVYWRIYELKFTNERFGDIDGLIARANFHYGRSGDGRKTDRYGKKYSWIAYFELAGFRQDHGNLPDFYDNGRCIETDIDPSFPDKHRKYNFVREDFLGDRGASTEQWVLKTPHPDLTPYLNVDQLGDEQGSWVLLHGHLGQNDKPASRKMSAWMQGLIVKPENVGEIVEILKRQENIDGHTVPFIPEDYRTYAGEIPWCDTYPANNWQEFSFLVRKYTIPKKQFELLRNDEPISLIDDFELWDTTRKLIEKDDEQRLNELLRERNLEIRIKTVGEEKFEHKDFEVLVVCHI